MTGQASRAPQRGGEWKRIGAVVGPPPGAPPKPDAQPCYRCQQLVEAMWLAVGKAHWHQPLLCSTCQRESDAAARADRREADRRRWLAERIERAGLGTVRREKTFAGFLDRPGTKDATRAAREFARTFSVDESPRRGLLFVGMNGSGKSHLATAILNQVLDANHTMSGLFVEFAEYLLALRDAFAALEADVTAGSLRHLMATVDLLVLDDLGAAASRRGGWDSEEMVRLLNAREIRGAPLVATADVDADELGKLLGSRVVSRLYGMCEVVPMADGTVEATDFRRVTQ